MKAVVTGVSSFTGSHIARAFAAAGFETAGLLTGRRASYAGAKAARLAALGGGVELVEEAPLLAPRFLEALDRRPEVFVHHGTYVDNYRSPDFDVRRAFEVGALPSRPLADALAARGCGVVLMSGTYYEPGEGQGDWPDRGVSPYAVSKAIAWELARFHLRRAGVPLVKVVIPNPIGRGESEDRLLPSLLRAWRRGEGFTVRTPAYVRDQLPATWLGEAYVRAAREALAARPPAPERVLRPSGFVGSVGEFVSLAAREVRARLGLAAEVAFPRQTAFDEPRVRANPDPCLAYLGRDEAASWDEFWKDLLLEPAGDAAWT